MYYLGPIGGLYNTAPFSGRGFSPDFPLDFVRLFLNVRAAGADRPSHGLGKRGVGGSGSPCVRKE